MEKKILVKGYDENGGEFFEHWFTGEEWSDADAFAEMVQERHAGSVFVVDDGKTTTRTFEEKGK